MGPSSLPAKKIELSQIGVIALNANVKGAFIIPTGPNKGKVIHVHADTNNKLIFSLIDLSAETVNPMASPELTVLPANKITGLKCPADSTICTMPIQKQLTLIIDIATLEIRSLFDFGSNSEEYKFLENTNIMYGIVTGTPALPKLLQTNVCHKLCKECNASLSPSGCTKCSPGFTLTSENKCICDLLSGDKCLGARPQSLGLQSSTELNIISSYFDKSTKRIEITFNKPIGI